MEPDCADNPFFMRAYFAWKLGLPFGYHVCDQGYLGKSPQTGQWVTNETASSKTNAVLAFNAFIRRIADGVHSVSRGLHSTMKTPIITLLPCRAKPCGRVPFTPTLMVIR